MLQLNIKTNKRDKCYNVLTHKFFDYTKQKDNHLMNLWATIIDRIDMHIRAAPNKIIMHM